MPFPLSLDLGLPNLPTASDKDTYTQLTYIYGAIRTIALALDQHSGVVPVSFTDPVAFGQAVNLYAVSSTLTARLAGALTGTKPMRGFCATPGGVAAGKTGFVKLSGLIEILSGLTPGALYYLSDTPGSYSLSPGTTTQAVGFALSTTVLYTNPTLV